MSITTVLLGTGKDVYHFTAARYISTVTRELMMLELFSHPFAQLTDGYVLIDGYVLTDFI